jgi:DNA-binding CsgD family transcriptional regulator
MGLEGRWDELREFDRARIEFVMSDVRSRATATLGRLARESGKPDRAWEYVRALHPDGPATEPGEDDLSPSVMLQQVAADLALDAVDLDLARSWIDAHDRWLEWCDAVLWRAEAQVLWGRYSLLRGETSLAIEHGRAALKHASEPRQPLALIAAHRFLSEALMVDEVFPVAEQHLKSAIDLARKCAAPFEVALGQLVLAELLALNGSPDDALSLLDAANDTCVRLNAVRALERIELLSRRLARVRAAPAPGGLTPREVEVLRLVAEGKSDREIGEALFISHRTVMRHVSNILGKLDVDSRAAAAAFAVRHELV